jgi:arylsulfatase A-like enzyme
VDLLPTILELVGAVAPADIDGTSMLPLVLGEVETLRHTALSEGGVARPQGDLPGAVIELPWTLLLHEGGCDTPADRQPPRAPGEPARCLYNVERDPGQDVLLSWRHPDVVERLLRRWKDFRRDRSREADQLELDPSFVEELRKSGYDFRADPP